MAVPAASMPGGHTGGQRRPRTRTAGPPRTAARRSRRRSAGWRLRARPRMCQGPGLGSPSARPCEVVLGGGGLGVQQGGGGAAEGQQRAQLGGLGAGDLEPDRGAVGDLGERAVGVGLQVPIRMPPGWGGVRGGGGGSGWRGPGEVAGVGAFGEAVQGGRVRGEGVAAGGDDQVVGPVGAVDRAASGLARKCSLTGTWLPPSSVMRARSQDVGSGERPGSRRRRTSRSVTTPVPAARWCAPPGRRSAPTCRPPPGVATTAPALLSSPSRLSLW